MFLYFPARTVVAKIIWVKSFLLPCILMSSLVTLSPSLRDIFDRHPLRADERPFHIYYPIPNRLSSQSCRPSHSHHELRCLPPSEAVVENRSSILASSGIVLSRFIGEWAKMTAGVRCRYIIEKTSPSPAWRKLIHSLLPNLILLQELIHFSDGTTSPINYSKRFHPPPVQLGSSSESVWGGDWWVGGEGTLYSHSRLQRSLCCVYESLCYFGGNYSWAYRVRQCRQRIPYIQRGNLHTWRDWGDWRNSWAWLRKWVTRSGGFWNINTPSNKCINVLLFSLKSLKGRKYSYYYFQWI